MNGTMGPYGKCGISIDGDPDYRGRVIATLDWIARSETGKVLLNGLKGSGKRVTISPFTGAACNATASPKSAKDATRAGYVVLRGSNSFDQLREPSILRDLLSLPKDPMIGTGKGSDAIVNFSPGMFGHGSTGACAALGLAGKPGASPSQVLFHELAHAYRQMKGIFNTRPTIAGSVTYTNMEEFFAVVLSNVMIADPSYSSGNRTLRADHQGFQALAPHLSTSKGFVAHGPNRIKMVELVQGDREFAKAVATVRSNFNPFAEVA